MYQDKMEFYPQFKAWVLTNEKPTIRGTEDPTWRRIKLLPFELQVPADKVRARQVVDAALDAERAGILAWAVRGCNDWQAREALGEPEVVTQAVRDYQGEMDIVGDFVADCMEPSTVGGKGTITRDAYKAFRVWCKDNGIKYVFTAKKFTVRLGKRMTLVEESAGHLRRCEGWKLNEDGLAMSEGRFA
jgi:putative DNA primase/helicase